MTCFLIYREEQSHTGPVMMMDVQVRMEWNQRRMVTFALFSPPLIFSQFLGLVWTEIRVRLAKSQDDDSVEREKIRITNLTQS